MKVFFLQAQSSTFWSFSSIGGDYNAGFIYKTDSQGKNFEIVHHFEGGEKGEGPRENLLEGPDERLYGIANGGTNATGIIYSISPKDYNYTIHHHFEGEGPEASILLGSNGKLYGFESTGYGYLFEYDLQLDEFNLVHSFDKDHGRVAGGLNMLTEINDHTIIGITTRGGYGDAGVIFKYDLDSSSYKVLFEFEGSGIGYYPNSIGPYVDGKLIGVTDGGWGTIFEFDYNTNEGILIFQFPSKFYGLVPEVVYGKDGDFYGVTSIGGADGQGSLFRYDPLADTLTTIHSFYYSSGPHIPETPLIQASNEKIYGSTTYISAGNPGITIFEYDPSLDVFSIPTSKPIGTSMHKLLEVICTSYNVVQEVETCDNYLFNGNELTQSGTYQALFQSVLGCDSTVMLDLTIADTCMNTSVSGISTNNFLVYPNPVHDYLVVELPSVDFSMIEIVDIKGKQILAKEVKEQVIVFSNLNIENGLYFISITSKNGQIYTYKIMKT